MAVDYDKVNSLSDQARNLEQAIANLDGGGRIVLMGISGPPMQLPEEGQPIIPTPPGRPAVVQTEYIDYPPTMVAAVKTALQQRYTQVTQELAGALSPTR